jgi:hypothetical protein
LAIPIVSAAISIETAQSYEGAISILPSLINQYLDITLWPLIGFQSLVDIVPICFLSRLGSGAFWDRRRVLERFARNIAAAAVDGSSSWGARC